MFHDSYGEECKSIVEDLTSEKKIPSAILMMQPTAPTLILPANIIVNKNEYSEFIEKSSETGDERLWSSNKSTNKQREKDFTADWEQSDYNSSNRHTTIKLDEDYSRSSNKYYERHDSRKEREYGIAKYAPRGDYERSRYNKKDRDKDRRDYRSVEDWNEHEKSRKYRDSYKDRYGYTIKGYTKGESHKSELIAESSENSGSTASYSHKYSYKSVTDWIPPPPRVRPGTESSPPKPPPEPPNDDCCSTNTAEKHKITDVGGATVDLDTRIAMLFESKSFGNDIRSLFQMEVDSDKDIECSKNDTVEEENRVEIDSMLVSSHPGHESKKLYPGAKNVEMDMQNLRLKKELEEIDENIKMEEGELVDTKIKDKASISGDSSKGCVPSPFRSYHGFKMFQKIRKKCKHDRSLRKENIDAGASDISSSEDEILAKGSYSPLLTQYNEKDDMSLSSLSSTEPGKTGLEIKTNNSRLSPMYPVAFSSYNAAYYQHSFHQFHQPDRGDSAGNNHFTRDYERLSIDEPHDAAVTKVINKLIFELKQILKKDINKRMIENTAFKKYEAWWDEQETSIRHHNLIEALIEPPATALTAPIIEPYQQSGGILRNLRFQRIKREPAPNLLQEDSRKSDPDDDDMVHGSDSEKEDVQELVQTSYIKTKFALSSSESSESSESSSDDEDEDREDLAYSSDTASMSNDEITAIRKTQMKREKDNRIYSDSETDSLKASAKSTPKVYSDSGDDSKPITNLSENKTSEFANFAHDDNDCKKTPTLQPTESDSDFFNDDVMSKPPRTPGRISSDELSERQPEKKSEYTKPIETNDRMYSDSEEERDYQEKIRRNTEWMEQIEREAKEEIERQTLLKGEQNENFVDTSQALAKNQVSNYGNIPKATTSGEVDKKESFISCKSNQDLGKKKRGRPKGSVSKLKDFKRIKPALVEKVPISTFIQPQANLKSTEEQKYPLKLSPPSSSDGSSSHASIVALEHCYSLPPSASPSSSSSPHDHQEIHMDHDYCGKSEVTPLQSMQPGQLEEQGKKEHSTRPVGRPRKDPNAPKAQYTKKDRNVSVNKLKTTKEIFQKIDLKQHQAMMKNFIPLARYEKRTNNDEFDILCRFLTQGIDQEDVDYMRQSYSFLIQNDIPGTELLHQVHWVDHCATERSFAHSLPKRRRKESDLPEMRCHVTGSARTEGYYKIDSKDKAHYKYHHLRGTAAGSHLDNSAKMAVAKMQNASREARSNQRRLLTAFGGATESDLLKFNQLKFRKKQLKFAKSAIHDWGLFAMEPIAADEMVIEYVGQMVRPSVADLRESKYEAIGIGSSYLFRIDLETIIDATKCGNLARFINHSCNVSLCFLLLALI